MKLKGKVAVITGAAQGIGYATARKFLDEGATVALVDLSADALQAARSALKLNGEIIESFADNVINVNLKGTYNSSKAVLASMLEQGSGVILNASSVVGIYGNFGQTNYAASKFGVIGFVKTWARELGPKGIRCNAVCPGFIATHILESIPQRVLSQLTERVPLRRLGRPDEVANVYAFLASDEASYINGAVIEVAGGLTV